MIRAVSSRSWSRVPGRGQRRAAYVVGEVEVLVVDPDRVGEAARDAAYVLAVARHERDPVVDVRQQGVVVEARVARVEDLEGRVVHGRLRRLLGQQSEVARAQPLAHPANPSPRVPWTSWDSGRGPSLARTPVPPAGGLDVPFRAPGRRARLRRAGPGAGGMRLGRLRKSAPVRTARRRRRTPAVRRPSTSPSRATRSRPQGAKVEVKAGKPLKLHITADKAGEIHVHSSPEQDIEYGAGHHRQDPHHRPARRRRRRVALARQADPPARGALSAPGRGPARACSLSSCPCTASAAPRTCPSRWSWRSRRAVAALIVSFCVLALAWRTAALRGPAAGPPGPGGRSGSSTTRGSSGRCGSLGLAVRDLPHLGADLGTRPGHQPGAGHLLRAGLGRASCRPRCCSARWSRRSARCARSTCCWPRPPAATPATGLATYPARLGYWPAAAGLFAFVWQELVNPQSAYLGSVRLWLAAYLAIMLIGAAVFGDEWLERADPFEVYSSLLAHLSAWGRDGDRLVVRSPAGQPRHRRPPPRPGGGGRGAVRLDGLRQLQGHDPVAAVRQRRGPRRRSSPTRWRCWSSA